MQRLKKIIAKRRDMKDLWRDNPSELSWRKDLDIMAIVDHQKWNKKWFIGQVVAVGHDPLLVLVVPNEKSMRSAEWFNR